MSGASGGAYISKAPRQKTEGGKNLSREPSFFHSQIFILSQVLFLGEVLSEPMKSCMARRGNFPESLHRDKGVTLNRAALRCR